MSSQYEFDPSRIAGSGEVVEGTAGAPIADRDICCVVDGLYYPADADLAARMPAFAISMSTMATGQSGEFLVKGFIGLASWTWTPGGALYVSGTPGQMSHTAGSIRQDVGVAFTATQVFINSQGLDSETGCALLEGHTAYIGFDNCKGAAYTNYWVCDGTADDVQLQAAIDYVVTEGGGSVFIEEGLYTMSVTVNWPTDAGEYTTPIAVVGTGWDSSLSRSANVPIFTINGGANRCRNILFRDLRFRSETYTGEFLRFVKADRIRIEDVLFQGSVAEAYAIYAEHTWDAYIYGCHFSGGGSATQPVVYLFNGADNNCNNWRFIGCRWERGITYNSLALHSDGTGAGSANQNIHLIQCKIHGVTSNPAFTSPAILFETTIRSSIKDSWIAHHLGDVVEIDQNCELVEIQGNNFLTFPAQGNPTAFISMDGVNCSVLNNFTQGTPTQLVLVGANATDVTVRTITSDTAGVTYLTDNGTDTITPEFTETAENPDSNIGRHPTEQMIDGVETTVRLGFTLPLEYRQVVTAQVVIVAAASGNLRWNAFTDFGKLCATEDYDAHSDSVGATTTAVTLNDLTCIDVSAALTGVAAGDRVGMEFWRDGDDALDTIGDTVYVVAFRLRYV